jgi:hypothetical protein
VLGPGDDEHGPVVLAREGLDEGAQPNRERERLVCLLSAERDEIMETSATSGAPSELGIPIASGLVPARAGPPAGGPRRGGEVAVRAATSPPPASFRTQ